MDMRKTTLDLMVRVENRKSRLVELASSHCGHEEGIEKEIEGLCEAGGKP
jgi:hypothetical protein